jgi:hypothetical protein
LISTPPNRAMNMFSSDSARRFQSVFDNIC